MGTTHRGADPGRELESLPYGGPRRVERKGEHVHRSAGYGVVRVAWMEEGWLAVSGDHEAGVADAGHSAVDERVPVSDPLDAQITDL